MMMCQEKKVCGVFPEEPYKDHNVTVRDRGSGSDYDFSVILILEPSSFPDTVGVASCHDFSRLEAAPTVMELSGSCSQRDILPK